MDHMFPVPVTCKRVNLLDNVVPVLILHAFKHLTRQLAYDLNLAVWPERFERLLDHTTAVHLQRQRHHIPSDCLHQLIFLLFSAILEEFLEENASSNEK
jgi:hypothetical protein